METRGRPRKKPADRRRSSTMLLTLKPEAVIAFNVLKAEQGARSGPRLAAEAIDLLLKKYGKSPVGWP
jgi:hypothetical protein